MEQGIQFVQDLAVILLLAGVVGWICQRFGLSVVVGYLLAGIVAGPYTPPFSLVKDADRIETLAQIGLVFLMFSVGLKLSLRKLRRLGFSLLAGVFFSAAVVYCLTRMGGAITGFSSKECVFLAAMLMVSSSSIIGKVLQETGATHERVGQLAMGVSVLEDVVAVVMLTLLGSMLPMKHHAANVGETLGLFSAFVVLAGVGGLLLVPWILRRLSISAGEELQTLGMAAMLFGLAMLAQRAGYSLALGAFLLGTIVAETPHHTQVERTFEGMRDVFTAVFFVTIGLQINVHELGKSWMLVVGLTAFTLFARTVATTLGLSMIGTQVGEALRVGMSVTVIGEFSFIIAQMGVGAGVVPDSFYSLAVGVCLLTTLVSPWLTRHSEQMSFKLLSHRPRWMQAWHAYYQDWLGGLMERQKRSVLWQLSRKRFIQIFVEMLLVTGLLVFSEPMRVMAERWLGRDWLFHNGLQWIFWVAMGLVIIAPLVAIWRNLSALSLLFAEFTVSGHPKAAKLKPIVEGAFKIVGGTGMFVWLSPLLPIEGGGKWLVLVSMVVALVALLLLKRKLVYWHSELEVELHDVFTGRNAASADTTVPWLKPHSDWHLSVIDCVLPDLADCQGKRISELELRAKFGCMVVGIGRQGFMISLPPPDTVLYPRDKVLLIGTTEQVEAGRSFLTRVSGTLPTSSEFDDVRMEAMAVPVWSRAAGNTLQVLSPAQAHHVQIAGIRRGDVRLLNPNGDEVLHAGDELLVLGTPEYLREFKDWLMERPEAQPVGK